jgi:myosin heavy subunit
MKLKIFNNSLKEENMKMKTQIVSIEKELEKRDKLVEDVLLSLNKNLKCSEWSLKDPASPIKQNKLMAILKSSLTNNLKKQVKDLRQELIEHQKERSDKKYTKMNEVTTELEVMQQEWLRLRTLLEVNFRAAPSQNNSEIKVLQHHNDEKNMVIEQMRDDNTALALACKEKEEQIVDQNLTITDFKNKNEKQKKLLAIQKKTKKQLREHQKEILRYKIQINEKNSQISGLKYDHQKKTKEKEVEVGRLKTELEILKNRPTTIIQNADLKSTVGKHNRTDSNHSSIKDSLINIKSKSQKSEREASVSSDHHEMSPAKSLRNSSPEVKEPVSKKLSKSNSKIKTSKELKHAIYQLNCKINENSIDVKQFITSIIFKDETSEKSIGSTDLTDHLKHFMNYSNPNEIDDLVKLVFDNKDRMTRQALTDSFNKNLNFKMFDEHSGNI